MPHGPDPVTGFYFSVSLDGGGGDDELGGFHEVSGLGLSIDVLEYREGGDREDSARKLPGRRHFSNVTLRRGLLHDTRLWEWISGDPPDKRTVVITLLDVQRRPRARFVLHHAWPCTWAAPELDAQGTDIAMETLELAHEGLEVELT